MSKHLLVTADDFGMCHSVNAGILRAISQGIVRSTNFMVPCPWFGHALHLAKEHQLMVGVHLCITCDWDRYRWGPITRAESLRDDQGYFLSSHDAVAKQAKESDIHDEMLAQIQRVKAMGYEPTHLDTHMMGSSFHNDYYDMVKAIVRKLGDRFGLIYTYETEGGVLRHFDAELEISSRPREEVIEKLRNWKEPGLYHFIGHAAEATAELDEMASPEHTSKAWTLPIRKQDTAFFVDPEVRETISSLCFELVTVHEVAARTRGAT
jgi:predicted glycoside hydrolase/deacetylase ChbG (UPF0249 family)